MSATYWSCKTTPFLPRQKPLCSQQAVSVHVSLNDNELLFTPPLSSVFLCIRWRVTIKNKTNPNEDSYVYSYIKLQKHCYETLLSLHLLECGENARQRTTGWGWKYANTRQSVSSRGRSLSSMTSYNSENQNGLIIETSGFWGFKKSEWIFIIVTHG